MIETEKEIYESAGKDLRIIKIVEQGQGVVNVVRKNINESV